MVNHVNVFQSPEGEILPTCEFNLTLSRFNFVKSQRRVRRRKARRYKFCSSQEPPQTPFHTSAQESHLCNGAHPSLRMSSGLTRRRPESRRPRGQMAPLSFQTWPLLIKEDISRIIRLYSKLEISRVVTSLSIENIGSRLLAQAY